MSDLTHRYNRGPRQLKRWIAEGVLPPADIIVGNHMGWQEASLDAADRKNTAANGARTEFGRRRKAIAAE
jgi:hypothetical protein